MVKDSGALYMCDCTSRAELVEWGGRTQRIDKKSSRAWEEGERERERERRGVGKKAEKEEHHSWG